MIKQGIKSLTRKKSRKRNQINYRHNIPVVADFNPEFFSKIFVYKARIKNQHKTQNKNYNHCVYNAEFRKPDSLPKNTEHKGVRIRKFRTGFFKGIYE